MFVENGVGCAGVGDVGGGRYFELAEGEALTEGKQAEEEKERRFYLCRHSVL